MAVHHKLEEILDAYLSVSRLRANPVRPLFPTTAGKSRKLGTRPMTRIDGANLLKRRLKKIGMVGEYSPHSFRATGITRFLEEGGTAGGGPAHGRSRRQPDHQAIRPPRPESTPRRC